MSRYKKGVAFERRIKYWLEEKGYYVIRSAGSHGIFDLIAIPKNRMEIYGIQLKSASEDKWGKSLESFRNFNADVVTKVLIVNGKDKDEIYIFSNNGNRYYETDNLS